MMKKLVSLLFITQCLEKSIFLKNVKQVRYGFLLLVLEKAIINMRNKLTNDFNNDFFFLHSDFETLLL